ncbi:DUF4422 domain-containing protein [Limosilactobacillus fermentum]
MWARTISEQLPPSNNTGDNISQKNPTYNERTAIYWGWKNLKIR